MLLLAAALGGALGASARYLLGDAMLRWAGPAFPWGTLTVNVIGSALMGALAAWFAHDMASRGGGWLGVDPALWRAFLLVGVLGGFTTFSAFSLDAVILAERGEMLAAGAYVLGSVVLCIAGLAIGLTAMRQVLS